MTNRVIVLLMSLILCFTLVSLTACGGSSDQADQTDDAAFEETQEEAQEEIQEEAQEDTSSDTTAQATGVEMSKGEIEDIVTQTVAEQCQNAALADLKVSDSGDGVYAHVNYGGDGSSASFALALFSDTIASTVMNSASNVQKFEFLGTASNASGNYDINYERGSDGKIYYEVVEKSGDFAS